MRYLKKKNVFIISVLLCMFWITFPVQGKSLVDVNRETSITIEYRIPHAEFSLYKVAEVTERYEFEVTEQFASYGIDYNALNTEQWKNMSETLAGYVARDQLISCFKGATDETGSLTVEGLSPGVYLVIGSQIKDEQYIYRCKPFLAFAPIETPQGEWNYHPKLLPKYSEEQVDVIDLVVIKIWKDEGLEAQRPEEILIQLLKDGEVYDEIILREENHWKHVWENLPSEYIWQAVEKEVPEGYAVEIIQEGNVFRIVNFREEKPDVPEKLPQTGQMWWPVSILTMTGLLFITVGLVRKRIEDN